MCILISLNEENGWGRWKPEHCSRHCYQKNQAFKNKGEGSVFTLCVSRLRSENTNSDTLGTSPVWFVCLFWCGKLSVNACRGSNADPQRFRVCEECFFPLKIYLFSYLCVHDCLYIWVCEHDCSTHRGQKGASDALELEFTGVVRHPLCRSDELRPSGCVTLYS